MCIRDRHSGKAVFEQHGVCWLEGVLSPELLKRCAQEAKQALDVLLGALERKQRAECRGLPAHLHKLSRLPVKCAEMIERDGGRFDCRYGLQTLATLLEGGSAGVGRLVALLKAILGPEMTVHAFGQVVALSLSDRERLMCAEDGGEAQSWHADDREHRSRRLHRVQRTTWTWTKTNS